METRQVQCKPALWLCLQGGGRQAPWSPKCGCGLAKLSSVMKQESPESAHLPLTEAQGLLFWVTKLWWALLEWQGSGFLLILNFLFIIQVLQDSHPLYHHSFSTDWSPSQYAQVCLLGSFLLNSSTPLPWTSLSPPHAQQTCPEELQAPQASLLSHFTTHSNLLPAPSLSVSYHLWPLLLSPLLSHLSWSNPKMLAFLGLQPRPSSQFSQHLLFRNLGHTCCLTHHQ